MTVHDNILRDIQERNRESWIGTACDYCRQDCGRMVGAVHWNEHLKLCGECARPLRWMLNLGWELRDAALQALRADNSNLVVGLLAVIDQLQEQD